MTLPESRAVPFFTIALVVTIGAVTLVLPYAVVATPMAFLHRTFLLQCFTEASAKDGERRAAAQADFRRLPRAATTGAGLAAGFSAAFSFFPPAIGSLNCG